MNNTISKHYRLVWAICTLILYVQKYINNISISFEYFEVLIFDVFDRLQCDSIPKEKNDS